MPGVLPVVERLLRKVPLKSGIVQGALIKPV
jgi:hypothetical protein